MSDVSAPPADRKATGGPSWRGRLLRITVSAGLIALLLWQYPISWSAITDTFRRANLLLVPVVLLLLLNQHVLSSLKWQLILRSHGIGIPLPTLVQSHLVGTFFGSFLPSSYAGDVVRIMDVGQATGRHYESASAVVLERLSGLTALAAVGSVASFYLAQQHDPPLFLVLGFLFLGLASSVIVIFVPGVAELLQRIGANIGPRFVRKSIAKITASVVHYRSRPRLLARILALSLVFQVLAYTIFFLYTRTIRVPVPYAYCLAFVPVVYLLEALPLSIAGLGFREGGLIFFLSQIGIPATDAISVSIVVLSCRYLVTLGGGVLFAVRRQAATTLGDAFDSGGDLSARPER